jgi:hypothetical protein
VYSTQRVCMFGEEGGDIAQGVGVFSVRTFRSLRARTEMLGQRLRVLQGGWPRVWWLVGSGFGYACRHSRGYSAWLKGWWLKAATYGAQ